MIERLARPVLKTIGGTCLVAAAIAATAGAQVRPDASWRTLRTEHFAIHFTPELEHVARRAAVQAETAYVQLTRHLARPRGRIDIVLSDDVDFSNGWATPFPSNRIGIYANPPVSESALRFTDDPLQLVITHELVHVFHLDRAGGIWKPLQRVFGRVPFYFPNAYNPRWFTEGLAVYYESKITGSGRIVGSDHHMVAHSAALARTLPRIDQLSSANPHFPYGASTYIYGSLFVDHLSRKYGDRAIRNFVESSSRQLIPLWINWPARRAFGRSLSSEWRSFTDSLLRSAPTSPDVPPMPGWRDVTTRGAYANHPSWLDDSTIVFTGTPAGRETYGAYTLMIQGGDPERIGRRNTPASHSLLPDGRLLFSQLEYTSPYTVRSDLYVTERNGDTRQLTRGARLSHPDARSDGRIVAVQTIVAATRLALVSADGRTVTPITTGSLDEHWAEPHWSPDGAHIVAVRWTRGGTNAVVVVDTNGTIVQTILAERAVASTPVWSPDGRWIYFTSDRDGVANVYRAPFSAGAAQVPLHNVSRALTGVFEADISPNGRLLTASVFKADGYHVGVAPIDSGAPAVAAVIDSVQPRTPAPVGSSTARVTRYSPWRSLLPTAWMPAFEPALDSNSVRYGAYISGSDIVGRHSYQATLLVPSDGSGLTGSLFYRNAIFGQPVVDVYYAQDWENRGCIVDQSQQGICSGILRRRIRDATAALTFQRIRSRSTSFLSIGGGLEARDYTSDPESQLARIDSIYQRAHYYPRTIVSAGWSNLQYPLMAISPEDGLSFSGTARHRWQRVRSTIDPTDSAAATTTTRQLSVSLVGSASAFKSLDLPGFGHHVLALNGAAGIQDSRGTGYFEVGGVSGASLDVVPGYVLGEGRRTFGVRGFPSGSLFGIRALKGSAEYRAPLVLPGRGLGTLPLFLERTGITLFGDAATAWCPGVFLTRPAPATSLCTRSDADGGFVLQEPAWIASAGAELNVIAAILSWDAPFRYRVGYALPVAGKALVPDVKTATFYLTVGASF